MCRTLLVAILSLVASPAVACTVPVFRYGLDHWTAADYVLEVPAKVEGSLGELTEAVRELRVNLAIDVVPGSRCRVFAPDGRAPIWTGRLDAAEAKRLVDSPARREIVKRLLAGESTVWIYVGGDTDEDRERLRLLRERVAKVAAAMELPVIDPDDPTSKIGPGPRLMLRFSVLHVRRDDPAESWFVRTLAGPRFEGLGDSPFIAPVFGRGRVLEALPAEFVDERALDEACIYLTRPCSCQVKDDNPGWDLLLSVDWEEALWEADDARLAAASISDTTATESTAEDATVIVETVVFGRHEPSASKPPAPGSDVLWQLAAPMLVLVCGSLLCVLRGGR